MSVSSFTNPLLEDALDFPDTGFERGGMITLVGNCEVDYDGRASSHLPFIDFDMPTRTATNRVGSYRY